MRCEHIGSILFGHAQRCTSAPYPIAADLMLEDDGPITLHRSPPLRPSSGRRLTPAIRGGPARHPWRQSNRERRLTNAPDLPSLTDCRASRRDLTIVRWNRQSSDHRWLLRWISVCLRGTRCSEDDVRDPGRLPVRQPRASATASRQDSGHRQPARCVARNMVPHTTPLKGTGEELPPRDRSDRLAGGRWRPERRLHRWAASQGPILADCR